MENEFFRHSIACGGLAPLAIVAAQCHQQLLTQFLAGPFSREHTSSVSESLIRHTLHIYGALQTSRRSPALSRTRIPCTILLEQSTKKKEQFVSRRIVAHFYTNKLGNSIQNCS